MARYIQIYIHLRLLDLQANLNPTATVVLTLVTFGNFACQVLSSFAANANCKLLQTFPQIGSVIRKNRISRSQRKTANYKTKPKPKSKSCRNLAVLLRRSLCFVRASSPSLIKSINRFIQLIIKGNGVSAQKFI